MTKFEAGLRYEMGRMFKWMAVFIAAVVAFLLALQIIARVNGFEFMYFSDAYSYAYLFLMFWAPAVFEKDANMFLQSGLARRQTFAIFVLATAGEALAFAMLDGALSLIAPGFWRGQSIVLGATGGYTAALFAHVLLLNLAVAFSVFAVAALQRRIGTGWTVALGLLLLATVSLGVPSVFSLFLGGTEALGVFVTALMGSPYAPAWSRALPEIFFAVVVVAMAALSWALMRRAEVR